METAGSIITVILICNWETGNYLDLFTWHAHDIPQHTRTHTLMQTMVQNALLFTSAKHVSLWESCSLQGVKCVGGKYHTDKMSCGRDAREALNIAGEASATSRNCTRTATGPSASSVTRYKLYVHTYDVAYLHSCCV